MSLEESEREEGCSTASASAEAPASRKSRLASEEVEKVASLPPTPPPLEPILAEPTAPSPVEKSSLGVWLSLSPAEGRGSKARPVTPPFRRGEKEKEKEREVEEEDDDVSLLREATAPLLRKRRSQSAIPLLPPVAARLGRVGCTQSREASEEAEEDEATARATGLPLGL
jgi:hypothetical protein